MCRLSFFAFALMLCIGLHAQLMPFKNYGIKDGLNDNNVQTVIQDDRGLLWIGTDFGVYWFDGKKFYQPPVKAAIGQFFVNDFYKDWSGNIWILTFFNGIYKFRDGRFTNYLPDTLIRNVTTNSASGMLQVSAGSYLVISDGSPYLFDGRSFILFDSSNLLLRSKTNSAALLNNQKMLISTESGVFIYQADHGKFRLMDHLLKDIATSKIVVAGNRLWIITGDGLMVFENNTDQPFSAPSETYFPGKEIKDLMVDKNGGIWILTDTLFKIKDKKITKYATENGMPDYIHHIYSNGGIVWLANRKGIGMLADEYYEFTPVKNGGENPSVGPVNTDRAGNLWIGTSNGLAIKTNFGYAFFNTVGQDTIGYVTSLYKNKKGILFAGTQTGLLTVEGNSIKKELNKPITIVTEDETERLWLGDINGNMWLYDKQLTPLKIDHFTSEMITCLYAQNGNVWVGYRGWGIRIYKLDKDSLILLAEYNTTEGYNDLRIRSCASDHKGNLFFGTRTNGLFIFSESSGNLTAHFTVQNGLNANWIKGIFCDTGGTLYLATNGGINILKGDYRKPVITQLKINNENINREANSILKTGDVFYIGTNEGVLKWMPDNMLRDTVAPPVYFTHIDIQGVKNFSVDPYTRDAGKVSLSYEQHVLSFEFAGINLKDPESVRYQYILEGQNNEWSPLTEYNFVTFNLKPGNYTFRVIAKNASGVASRNAAVFHFIINPPFWNSWWFIVIIILVVVLVAYGAYRYKLSQVMALEQLRNKISTDLHDDIGSTLSSISILSDMALKEPSHTYVLGMIKEIKENSTFLLEKMDDIVWSINPQNDTLENLMVRMQRFAAVLLEAKNIDYSIEIEPTVRNVKLSMSYRQHIYLILKETINNLVKYSNATKAYIRVVYQNNVLGITIQDNGVGFDTGARQFGNGIINMRQRAKLMNTTITIDSKPGAGTTIFFSIKIK